MRERSGFYRCSRIGAVIIALATPAFASDFSLDYKAKVRGPEGMGLCTLDFEGSLPAANVLPMLAKEAITFCAQSDGDRQDIQLLISLNDNLVENPAIDGAFIYHHATRQLEHKHPNDIWKDAKKIGQ